jgi:arylsulfatase A-like enzyme
MNLQKILLAVGILAVAGTTSAWAVAPGAAAPKPNIVFILIDDMGWRDIGANGSKYYRTPNIDRLAGEGVRFTNYYAPCAVCSPSRAAMMTGLSPARLHVTDWIPGEQPPANARFNLPQWTKALDPTVPNLPKALHELGYATASIGKWHLGGEGHLPQDCGFDLNVAGGDIGHPASYFWPYGAPKNSHRVPMLAETGGEKGEYLTDRLTDEALRFIEQHQKQPFYLYLAHYAVHAPLMSKAEDSAEFENTPPVDGQDFPTYAGMVKAVDDSVGRVLETLKKLGLEKSTIVVFTSDNGGACHFHATKNRPLRGGKGFPYEGGLRVPLIVKVPGVTKAGLVSDSPVIGMDFLPTFLSLLGAKPVERTDGIDITSALQGKPLPQRQLGWNYPHYWGGQLISPYAVLRDGNWKIVRWYEYDSEELYNLATDPSEKTDLAKKEPAQLASMHQKLDAWLKANNAQAPILKPNAPAASAPESNPAAAAKWY